VSGDGMPDGRPRGFGLTLEARVDERHVAAPPTGHAGSRGPVR